MNLHRLIYSSVRLSKCTDQEILKILDACEKNNSKVGITGILLHSKSRFIQYLEGDKDQVEGLYNKIKKDARHGGVNLRMFEPIDERIFPNWNMGYKDVDRNTLAYNTNTTSKHSKEIENIIEGNVIDDRGVNILRLFFEVAV